MIRLPLIILVPLSLKFQILTTISMIFQKEYLEEVLLFSRRYYMPLGDIRILFFTFQCFIAKRYYFFYKELVFCFLHTLITANQVSNFRPPQLSIAPPLVQSQPNSPKVDPSHPLSLPYAHVHFTCSLHEHFSAP